MDFDKKTMESLMIDHIDGKITGELARYVEIHLKKNPQAKAEYYKLKEMMEIMDQVHEAEVPHDMKDQFLQLARAEFNKPEPLPIKTFRLNYSLMFKIAAAIAFVVVGYIGSLWINDNSKEKIITLQQELNKSKQLVFTTMMQQESASERLKGILTSYEFEDANDDIVDALILAMNQDDNINVRIAAAEALARFSTNEKARLALIASLNNQSYPAVQIKLIDILVVMGDKNALNPMIELSEKEDVMNSVRDEAHMGIFKLM